MVLCRQNLTTPPVRTAGLQQQQRRGGVDHLMASRNAAFKELVQGRRKSSEMMSPLPPDAGLAEPEEQQPSCSKAAKKKKKKRPQEEDDHEQGGAEAEPKATRAKSRSHDSKAELKKKELDQQKQGLDGADKKAESFIDQAGTSAAVR